MFTHRLEGGTEEETGQEGSDTKETRAFQLYDDELDGATRRSDLRQVPGSQHW